MAYCVGTTFDSFLDYWLHCAAWLCPNQFEALKVWRMCFVFFCFCQQFAACLSSSCLVSICLLLSMENHSLLSKKNPVHVLFVALYCVKSQETYRVKSVSFRANFQLYNKVKRRAQVTRFLYSNLACVRKRLRAHTQGRK